METTSNDFGICALTIPARKGTTKTIDAAAANMAFLLQSRWRIARPANIASKRTLRSAPVTPETQARGDST